MGICGSTNNKEGVIEEVNEDLNFEKAREEYRDKRDDNVYEVKAKLYEFVRVNTKLTRKSLISKYLFFTPNGKFSSSVSKTMFSDLLIEGWLNPKGLMLSLITKQHLVENNSYQIKTYEGKLSFSEEGCKVIGKVTEDGPQGKVLLEKVSFELDFTTDLWKGNFMDNNKKACNLLAYIRFKDLFYTGIAISEKGVSLLRGVDTNKKCNLVQIYIEPDETREKNIYSFVGIKDTIANKFEGVVNHRDLDKDTKIVFELKGNPKKAKIVNNKK